MAELKRMNESSNFELSPTETRNWGAKFLSQVCFTPDLKPASANLWKEFRLPTSGFIRKQFQSVPFTAKNLLYLHLGSGYMVVVKFRQNMAVQVCRNSGSNLNFVKTWLHRFAETRDDKFEFHQNMATQVCRNSWWPNLNFVKTWLHRFADNSDQIWYHRYKRFFPEEYGGSQIQVRSASFDATILSG